MPFVTDDWYGLYKGRWNGEIVAESVTHPAKFARLLVKRIYEHMGGEGWLKPGDTVFDPFGGVALGAFYAMANGYKWTGVELESKFVGMGMENIAAWNNRYSELPHWCSDAVLLCGDSRKLGDVIGNYATAAISSPPYSCHALGHAGTPSEIDVEKKLYSRVGGARYGMLDGNLGNMTDSDAGFACAVSSLPYSDGCAHTGGDDPRHECIQGGQYHGVGLARSESENRYGDTDGQLGAMPAGEFRAAMKSPPYEACLQSERNGIDWSKVKKDYPGRVMHDERIALAQKHHEERRYSADDDNVGNKLGDEFWTAARAIVDQVYSVLVPGGHAVWVVKDYVRDKARVPFCDQWRQLCEAAGFVTLHQHRAWLVENNGTAYTLEGGAVDLMTERKSFFRRLAEKKGSPRIDYEIVWCMQKPDGVNL